MNTTDSTTTELKRTASPTLWSNILKPRGSLLIRGHNGDKIQKVIQKDIKPMPSHWEEEIENRGEVNISAKTAAGKAKAV